MASSMARSVVTRRGLQLALALLWLIAAGLQYQPYMFGTGFRTDVIGGAGAGQPGWVAAGPSFAEHLLAHAPVLLNALFATLQLALGLGLLWRRTVRVALIGSVVWGLAVWYLGEGLGGVASGHADLLTGTPGAAVLYAVVAVMAWPRATPDGVGEAPPPWSRAAWAAVWVLGGVLRALPGQNTPAELAAEVRGNTDGAPGWLASADTRMAGWVHDGGTTLVVCLIVGSALIGLLALAGGRIAQVAVSVGTLLAVAYWVFGQSLGELYTGQSTDVNTAPVIVLLGAGVFGSSAQRYASARRTSRALPGSQGTPHLRGVRPEGTCGPSAPS